jgi:hypothetical protein
MKPTTTRDPHPRRATAKMVLTIANRMWKRKETKKTWKIQEGDAEDEEGDRSDVAETEDIEVEIYAKSIFTCEINALDVAGEAVKNARTTLWNYWRQWDKRHIYRYCLLGRIVDKQ